MSLQHIGDLIIPVLEKTAYFYQNYAREEEGPPTRKEVISIRRNQIYMAKLMASLNREPYKKPSRNDPWFYTPEENFCEDEFDYSEA